MGDTRSNARLLDAATRGDVAAADELLPLVYSELHDLARAHLLRRPQGHTLQPTSLVHEAYLRLIGDHDPGWEGRRHFFFAAARAMRDILVEHARRKGRLKRGGDRKRVDLHKLTYAVETPPAELLALEEALCALELEHERRYRVVMLRFFVGLSVEEIAELLGVTARTIGSDWSLARVRLAEKLASASER